MAEFHKPVLLHQAIELLNVKRGEKYIDATVGGGGHAEAILKIDGRLLAIDYDPEAIKAAREHLSTACPNAPWRLAQGNFKDLANIAEREGFPEVSGILFDFGVSSYQLENSRRGFSFSRIEPLDMRMDPTLAVTAEDLVNGLRKDELEELFTKLGQEWDAGRIAEAIVRARDLAPIKDTQSLAKIVIEAKFRNRKPKKGKTHPATKVFQALRIAVNDELNNIRQALPQALSLLCPGGRLVTISFHSGEDRLVKQFVKESVVQGQLKAITKKPLTPSWEEVRRNPRSRSAKLRAAEKI